MAEQNKKKDSRLYNKNFIQACNNAVNGIVYCATTQPNVKKELVLGTLVMLLSLFYNFTSAEFLCLTFAVFFVIFAELVNTAIESIVDLLVDVYHPKAKVAKDIGAGAVVLSAVNAVIVAYFLFFHEKNLTLITNSIFSQMIESPIHLTFVGIILTIIAVLVLKAGIEEKRMISGVEPKFIPSGQSAVAFAILTAVWMTSRNPVIFCLALTLSLLVVGNRMNDARTFGEVVFGAFMGMLLMIMIYGMVILRING